MPAGLRASLLPCAQVLEDDGRRHEMWRTPFTPQLVSMLRPALAQLPPAYRHARAFHVGVHPDDPSLPLLRELRAAGPAWLSAETFAPATAAVPAAALRRFMELLDVFSPNEAEAGARAAYALAWPPHAPSGVRDVGLSRCFLLLSRAAHNLRRSVPPSLSAASMLYGPSHGIPEAARREPRRLTEPFLEAGAGLVALRRGPLGAVVHDGASGECWSVPAVPGTRVVDPTGCGNACCGALLAALGAGHGPRAAAAWGCAAGSLMAEAEGTLVAAPRELAAEACARQARVLELAQAL